MLIFSRQLLNLYNILNLLKKLISNTDLTCQIHPAKEDYKYISVVAEEISGQHFDIAAIFKKTCKQTMRNMLGTKRVN